VTTVRVARVRRGSVVVVLGVLCAGAVVLAGCTGGQGSEPEPADAVIALFDARRDGSCDAYVETTTDFFRNDMYLGSATCDDFADEADAFAERGPVQVDVESDLQVDVDTSQVEVVETYRAGTDDEFAIVMAYRVQLEDGVWKVDHADLTVLRD
jgi:hypothetical protein